MVTSNKDAMPVLYNSTRTRKVARSWSVANYLLPFLYVSRMIKGKCSNERKVIF